jgi:hypothetical protein
MNSPSRAGEPPETHRPGFRPKHSIKFVAIARKTKGSTERVTASFPMHAKPKSRVPMVEKSTPKPMPPVVPAQSATARLEAGMAAKGL